MVWNLLRKNISVWQLAGYALATLAGLTIVIVALQFYRDLRTSWDGDGDDGLVPRDYLVISKPVSMMSVFGRGDATFDEAEIAGLEAQPWVARVGRFTASDFGVSASMTIGVSGVSTSLFFESVPDGFLDRMPDGWGFNPEEPVISIILSKDYLSLYNFGFAASRGLPQLNEKLISRIPLTVTLAGNGRSGSYTARVVGFSNRLNTIAVPESFMAYARELYGHPETSCAPSRLIVEVTRPGASEITDYMEARGYETAGDKVSSGRVAHFFSVLTSIVVAVGCVIAVLAFFILMLSIFLLLHKNRETLRDLMLLGYSPAQVSRCYYILVAAVNGCVLLVAVAVLAVVSRLWISLLAETGVQATSLWPSVSVAAAVMAVITLLNALTIRKQIRRYF